MCEARTPGGRRCGREATTTFPPDLTGQTRYACSLAGHFDDVLKQRAEAEATRYRGAQPWNDQFSIRDARPEWRMR